MKRNCRNNRRKTVWAALGPRPCCKLEEEGQKKTIFLKNNFRNHRRKSWVGGARVVAVLQIRGIRTKKNNFSEEQFSK